ncbi:hypothetical protein CAQUA_05900 [Corynebacterium aquatimens]|nr:hypothetical protein CAQUA_05900 [Corynebacterium aquatimens]
MIFAVLGIIILLTVVAFVPLFYTLFQSPGIKTEGIDAKGAQPASTDVNGTWEVSRELGKNATSAGYTFYELLPGDERITSGSTQSVKGQLNVENGSLTAGEITVDMATITSDKDVRDENVRRKILHTDEYPESKFVLSEPADVTQLPDDGTVGTLTLTGDLTIHGTTKQITQEFNVLRTGDKVVVAADVPIKREDYGVESPDFVAAKIADEGEINLRVKFEKRG